MFTLRPYQEQAVASGLEYLLDPKLQKLKRNGLIYLGTGAGKSLVIGTLAVELANHGYPVIVFQPTKEILEQNLEKIREYGFEPAVFSASKGRREIGEITLATIGSVWKHPELFEDFAFAIPDECHLMNPKESMYNAFRQALPNLRFLGLTASPYRQASNMNGTELRFITRTRPRIFTDIVHYTQNSELVEQGFWSKLEYKIVKGFDRKKVALNSNASDYDPRSLQMHLFEIGHTNKLVEVVQRAFAAGRKNMIVFTQTIEDSHLLLSKMGSDFAMVTGETPKVEREAIINGFRSGAIKGITNVGVLVHGFDYPELECVIDAAPSLSLSRVYQKHGRVVRPHLYKSEAWIVDMVGSLELFGRIEDLTLYCEGDTKWFISGRPYVARELNDKKWTEPGKWKPLTNTPLLGDEGRKRCRQCGSTEFFFMRHEVTGKSAMLSRPTENVLANLVIRYTDEGKKVYAIAKRGDEDYDRREFILHLRVCRK